MKLAATCLFLCLSAATAFAAPAIVVDQPVFNFGTINEGAKVEHVFAIKNGGDTPLSILQVRASCGCTATTVSSSTIQPGKSGEVKATFNSANFTGSVTKTIAVETNDPKAPNVTLTLKGNVSTDLQLTPKQLNFGQVKVGTPQTLSINVKNNGNRTINITSVKTPMPQVVVRANKQQLKHGESASIDVTVAPRPEDRILSGYVTIATDSPAKPEVTVPVYGSPVK